jgi:DNA-binding GntR family transcriptional regulator
MTPAEEAQALTGPISSPTMMHVVASRLRESILRGRFGPGERIVEADLARELGTSRGPVREALALLEKDGIVENVPRKGKFVVHFDRRLVDEIYSLRKVLEAHAAELIIGSLTDAKREALSNAVTSLEEAANAASVSDLAERDLAFHNLLYDLADHQLMRAVWMESIAGKLRILVNVTTQTHEPLADAGANHRVLVEAILRRQAREARRLISQHIDDAWQRAISSLWTKPEPPACPSV